MHNVHSWTITRINRKEWEEVEVIIAITDNLNRKKTECQYNVKHIY